MAKRRAAQDDFTGLYKVGFYSDFAPWRPVEKNVEKPAAPSGRSIPDGLKDILTSN